MTIAAVGVVAPASATSAQPELTALENVSIITKKVPQVLAPGSQLIEQQAVVASAKPQGLKTELVAAVASVDKNNSIVAKSGTAQSLITVLKNGDSSADFKLSIPAGYKTELNADGSIQLRSKTSQVIIPFIKAPWALDANGKKLDTSYTLQGSIITQHVNTIGASYPVVADPSIQWIPYPVVAMWGYQAELIAKAIATIIVAAPGGACTLIAVGGWIGKAFSAICSLIGIGAAKDVFKNIANIWNSHWMGPFGCYGIQLWNTKAKPANMPSRDCA